MRFPVFCTSSGTDSGMQTQGHAYAHSMTHIHMDTLTHTHTHTNTHNEYFHTPNTNTAKRTHKHTHIRTLSGTVYTGCDLNTSIEDMEILVCVVVAVCCWFY